MKKTLPLLAFCYFLTLISFGQDWREFKASDGVTDFVAKNSALWVSTANGLWKIDLATEEKTNWNRMNSEIPNYGYTRVAVTDEDVVWLGGLGTLVGIGDTVRHELVKFDGNTWESYSQIAGFSIASVKGLKESNDGKVWMLVFVNFMGQKMFYHENGIFTEVALPSSNLDFNSGTLFTDANSNLWVALRDNDTQERFIGQYDGNQWIIHDIADSAAGSITGATPFCQDSEGNIYTLFGAFAEGSLLKYDGVTWTSVDAPITSNDFLNEKRIMFVDANDQIWIGVKSQNAFAIYDGQEWTFQHLTDFGFPDGFPDGLFIDGNENQWTFHWEGVNFPRLPYLYKNDGTIASVIDFSNSSLPTNDLNGILIDGQQNKWFSTRKGMIKFDGNEWVLVDPNLNYAFVDPQAVDPQGNIWMSPYASNLVRFDGVTFSDIPVTNADNQPYDFLREIVTNKEGTVFLATGDNEMLVFDKGDISYFDNIQVAGSDGYSFPDKSYDVAIDTFGNLYNVGFQLSKYENEEWTQIPLWTDSPSGAEDIAVAPNQDIYYRFGISLPGEGISMMVFDGANWELFDSPFTVNAFPKWDSQGQLWLRTDQGLCKQNGNDWICYSDDNSPLNPYKVTDFAIDQNDNIWITLHDGGLMLFNENQIQDIESTPLPEITGSIYRDFNQNGQQDPEDLPLALQKVTLSPLGLTTFTNFDGSYRFSVPPGEYDVQYLPIENWTIDNSSDDYEIDLTLAGVSELDFRVAPIQEIDQLEVFLNEGFPRCNTVANYYLTTWNYGTSAADGELRFHPDAASTLVQSFPPPNDFDGDTMIWIFNEMLPYESNQVYLQIQMPSSDFLDSTLVFQSFIDKIDGGSAVRLDSSIANQMLLCAYDPNDKMGQSEGETRNGQSLFHDALNYTIRFQNTGNDTAFTVVVRDTLSENLDLNTFEILATSHAFTSRLESNGAVEFKFENIELPDSTTNYLGSQGFINFRIKTLDDLPSPTTIQNTAYIYFDFNDAIVTNTAMNELVDEFVPVFNRSIISLKLSAFPNPATTEVWIKTESSVMENFNFQIFNTMGQSLKTGKIKGRILEKVNLNDFPNGIYWIHVQNGEKFGSIRFVKT